MLEASKEPSSMEQRTLEGCRRLVALRRNMWGNCREQPQYSVSLQKLMQVREASPQCGGPNWESFIVVIDQMGSGFLGGDSGVRLCSLGFGKA